VAKPGESPPARAAGRVRRTPSRPGPGPTPPAVLRALDLTIRRRIDSLVPGEHRAPALGHGSELAQVRPYQLGDDVRQIDWNVTARTGEPHVRVHVAERTLTTWLLLDRSASMSFGTADRRKADVAEGAALAIGHVATRQGNRLGMIAFGAEAPEIMRPLQGRSGMLGLLARLQREPLLEGGGPTRIGDALSLCARVARQRGLVVIVSDFRGPQDWRGPLLRLLHRHHVVAIEVRDPREQELPALGVLWLVDPETGRQLRVDTNSRRLRQRFAARAAEERGDLACELRRAGADHVVLSNAGDWLRELSKYLDRRRTRR
jgi:uncharacterized protein (DUF58 family)